MSAKPLASEQSARLSFLIDPRHPQDTRQLLESWLKPLRFVQLADWKSPQQAQGLLIWLPAPGWQRPARLRGTSVFVRPLHQDLLALAESGTLEADVDVVLEARHGEGPFYDLLNLLLARELAREESLALRRAQRGQRQLRRLVQQALETLAPAEAETFIGLFSRYLELQEQLAGAPSPETLAQNLELLARRLDKKRNWQLQSYGLGQISEEALVCALGHWQGAPYFLVCHSPGRDPGTLVAQALIVVSMRKILRRWSAQSATNRPHQLVRDAFQALPLPVLLTGPREQVLQHNTAFVKLNLTPSKVLRLGELESVAAREQRWSLRRVVRTHLEQERVLHTFVPEQGGAGPVGSAAGPELGIITSSIAHELNNPIGGVLVALEMLALEDFWDEEARDALAEMRQGALRAKRLIETFLDFSRPNAGPQATAALWAAFEQALNLQRFRMIESGLRVHLQHRALHPYSYPLHGPSTTMLAYLVLGELMTAFHHLKLLESKSSRGLSLEVTLVEDADRFGLLLHPPLPLKQGLEGKLLQYLLQQERLGLEKANGEELSFSRLQLLL